MHDFEIRDGYMGAGRKRRDGKARGEISEMGIRSGREDTGVFGERRIAKGGFEEKTRKKSMGI